MSWLEGYRRDIAALDIPADAKLDEVKRILRKARADLGVSQTSWGRKVWPRACREVYARHGYKSVEQIPRKHLSPLERLMAKAKERQP